MFTKDFLAVSGINFIYLLPHYILFVTSVPYAVERFNASASIGGLVAGVMVLGILVGRFFSGRLIAASYSPY